MSLTARQTEDILQKYNAKTDLQPGETMELEIRFKNVTKDVFGDFYAALSKEFGPGQLECSVNFISNNIYEKRQGGRTDETQYIRKVVFDGTTPMSDTYHSKLRVGKPVVVDDHMKYIISLAKEATISKFSTATNAIVRFKLRMSFNSPGWRFDLTGVRSGTMSSLGNRLAAIKQELFGNINSGNFMQAVVDTYEIEIERTSNTILLADLDIIRKTYLMVNPQYTSEIAYRNEIQNIAKYLFDPEYAKQFSRPEYRLKQLGNQVIALSKTLYYSDKDNKIYPPVGYYGTVKMNGQRVMISINGNRCRIVKSYSIDEFISGEFVAGPVTIVDAEEVTVDSVITYYVFEVLVLDDQNISQMGIGVRIDRIPAAIDIISPKMIPGRKVATKKQVLLGENLESDFKEIEAEAANMPNDGIIISEPGKPYRETRNYKWKPYEHTTVDFLAIKCPQSLLGIKPYVVVEGKTLYLLFVGINQKLREKLGLSFIPQYKKMFPQTDPNYYPIQFSPSANPLAYLYYHTGDDIDHKIVELSRTEDNSDWIFNRIRTDRKAESDYYGNDFRVAELTYSNYIDPFNFEDLWKQPASYFTKTASTMYEAGNEFKRFVISNILANNLSNSKWIIDEAAGRGGDLHRYRNINIENALFIDVDPTAIAELIRRKFTFFHGRYESAAGRSVVVAGYDRVHGVEYDRLVTRKANSLTIHTLVADLKTPYRDLIASTFQYGVTPGQVDGIVCNFAIHYMCDTIEHLRNLLIFNSRMLKIGGLFIFTVMDGKAVFELLRPLARGQQWESRSDGVLKYAIKKNYSGEKLSHSGQLISVLLPFSDEMYDEPLCNIEAVISEAAKIGFDVELNSSMITYAAKFATARPVSAAKLTQEDRDYIALHRFCSLRKTREIKKQDD